MFIAQLHLVIAQLHLHRSSFMDHLRFTFMWYIRKVSGEMSEWFKEHAWKACVGNTTVGSNPTLSA
jgi:hypothetical protein